MYNLAVWIHVLLGMTMRLCSKRVVGELGAGWLAGVTELDEVASRFP